MNPRPHLKHLDFCREDRDFVGALLAGDTAPLAKLARPGILTVTPYGHMPTVEFALLYAPWSSIRALRLDCNWGDAPLYRFLGKPWVEKNCTYPCLAVLNDDPAVLANLLCDVNARFQINRGDMLPYPSLLDTWHGSRKWNPDPEFTEHLAASISHLVEKKLDGADAAIIRILGPTTDQWKTWEPQPVHRHPLVVQHYTTISKLVVDKLESDLDSAKRNNQGALLAISHVITTRVNGWLKELAKSYVTARKQQNKPLQQIQATA